MRVRRRAEVLMAATLPVLLAAGCGPLLDLFNPNPKGEAAARLRRFESPEALLRYFKDQALEQVRADGRRFLFPFFLAAPEALDADAGTADTAGGNGDGSFSTTNLQEAGVDESDVFKSDGEFFYIARGQSLRIVRARPLDQMAEVGRLDLQDQVREMYLVGDRLILLAQQLGEPAFRNGDADLLIWPPYYFSSTLVLYQVDVSDQTAPAVEQTIELDGSLVSSRLTNGRLILVLTIAPALPEPVTRAGVQSLTLDEVMPRARAGDAERDLVEWQEWYRPEGPDGYFMTAVVTLDASDISTQVASAAVIANAGTIYASPDALYITDADYDPQDNFREKTAIHKFAFDEAGAAQYVASGRVPGRLLNQFSLGEQDGFLRVATHVSSIGAFGDDVIAVGVGVGTVEVDAEPPASEPGEATGSGPQQTREPVLPSNSVYVLAENVDADLEIVGAVEEIAPNEQIYSARFLGDRGYLVTFRQIDPLFVLDLSDPADPQIAGQLKVPGFSDYLHPVGDGLLLGIGRSTRETSFGGVVPHALQISLFDVSDPTNPTAIKQMELGGSGSTSEVSFDHKAFAFLPESGRFAIPVTLVAGTGGDVINSQSLDSFVGVLAFQIDASQGFVPIGDVQSISAAPFDFFFAGWQRAAFIGERLYALNPSGVRGMTMSDASSVRGVAFSE